MKKLLLFIILLIVSCGSPRDGSIKGKAYIGELITKEHTPEIKDFWAGNTQERFTIVIRIENDNILFEAKALSFFGYKSDFDGLKHIYYTCKIGEIVTIHWKHRRKY